MTNKPKKPESFEIGCGSFCEVCKERKPCLHTRYNDGLFTMEAYYQSRLLSVDDLEDAIGLCMVRNLHKNELSDEIAKAINKLIQERVGE